MKGIRHEGRETASPTPILDKLLRELPPPKLEQRLSTTLREAEQAKERLLIKIDDGKLTRTDIEQELSRLPDEQSRIDIISMILINLPYYDIKKLPV